MATDLEECRATVAPDADSNFAERTAYRYDRLSLRTIMADMRFEAHAPKPGDPVPPFDLPALDGAHVRSGDLGAGGPMLLIFGSLTCPMTDSAMPGLRDLHRRYGGTVRFVLVNVREAHPGMAVPQPATLAAKSAHAQRLRDVHCVPFAVAVDDISGTFHRAMSAKPNSAYLVGNDGRILFRAHWANDTAALGLALEAVTAGRMLTFRQSGGLLRPMLRMLRDLAPVLDRVSRPDGFSSGGRSNFPSRLNA